MIVRPSHERVLYTKLLKFREEHLENYQGPMMEYSQSDHHHIPVAQPPPVSKLPVRSSTRASLAASRPKPGHELKTTSQYSLLHEDSVRKRQKTRHPSVADTEHSYDPFRSSRRPVHVSADYAKITVHRSGSSGSQQKIEDKRLPSRVSSRHPAFDRIDEVGDYSIVSSPPPQPRVSSRISQHRTMSHGVSRISVASTSSNSRKVSSVNPKRRVSFARNRRVLSVQQPASKPPTEPLPSPPPLTLQQMFVNDGLGVSQNVPLHGAKIAASAQVVRSRKPVLRSSANRNSAFWREDTHRVSSELGKVCDEAFNRDSAVSSVLTAATSRPDRHSKSTETSMSLHDKTPIQNTEQKSLFDRPLPPPPPPEYIGNIAQRELAKAREMLKQRAADPSLGAPGCLDDVIAHLDRLMQPSTMRVNDDERRAVSAPQECYSGVGLEPRKDTFERFLENGYTGWRAISEPVQQAHQKPWNGERTIRLVDTEGESHQISPTKPLTIRKKSNGSMPSDGSERKRRSDEDPGQLRDNPWSYAEWRSSGLGGLEEPLPQIDEENKENVGTPAPTKRTWFGMRANPRKQHLKDDRPAFSTGDAMRRALGELKVDDAANIDKGGANGLTDEFPPGKERGRFFKIFGKHEKKGGRSSSRTGAAGKPLLDRKLSSAKLTFAAHYDLDDTRSQTTATTITNTTHEAGPYMSGALADAESSLSSNTIRLNGRSFRDHQVPASTVTKPHTNWFARFLRIKPASYTLCLQIPKIQARREIARVLRGWKKYGLRDLVIDKTRCVISVRVDGKNGKSFTSPHPDLPAVLFTVLSLHCVFY